MHSFRNEKLSCLFIYYSESYYLCYSHKEIISLLFLFWLKNVCKAPTIITEVIISILILTEFITFSALLLCQLLFTTTSNLGIYYSSLGFKYGFLYSLDIFKIGIQVCLFVFSLFEDFQFSDVTSISL